MFSQTERLLASAEGRKKELAEEGKQLMDTASEEDRGRTPEENARLAEIKLSIDHIDKEIGELKAQVDVDRSILEGAKGFVEGNGVRVDGIDSVEVKEKTVTEIKTLGDAFIESKGYKEVLDAGRGGDWSTGTVGFSDADIAAKTALTSTVGSVLTPRQYIDGIVQTLYQRNYVADLFPNVQTTGNQITYVSETTATNAAAATAEAAAKPESTLAFGEANELVRKLSTSLPIADEVLADAPTIRQYVNSRLTLFILNVEETQLLLGSGSSPNIAGVISPGSANRTIGTYARGTVDSNAVAVFKASNGARGSSQLDMEALVIHPTNWQAIRLATDTSGQFYGGGPFYGPYGGPQGPASASQFMAEPGLWGMNVLVTSNITIGTALVGNFSQGGAVFRRSGIVVEASNSHSTFFTANITTLRAEERLALAIYRPSAFVAVTGLS